jgi:RNA polymerase primary sigma factor
VIFFQSLRRFDSIWRAKKCSGSKCVILFCQAKKIQQENCRIFREFGKISGKIDFLADLAHSLLIFQRTKSSEVFMSVSSARDCDVIRLHLNEVKKIPLLTNEEEVELAKRAEKGDRAAHDKLLTSNMRFVIKIASQYLNRGLEYEDLISEGYLGLMKALEHFDVSKGYHFISYAVWWIRQSILKALIDIGRPIRLPANKDAELREIKKACRNVNPLGHKSEEDELAEVAEKLGMTKYHVREMINISREMISLDSPISFDSENPVMDLVSVSAQTPEDEIIDLSLKDEIEKVLEHLDEKSAQVIRMRYGLGGQAERTLKEVGEKMNLSRERVRQIEKNAIAKIRSGRKIGRSLKDYVA